MTSGRQELEALVGNASYAASQFALLLLIPTLVSLEDLGVYSLALAIAAPVQLGLAMNVRSVRVVESDADFSTRDFFAFTAAAGIVSVVVSSLIAAAFMGFRASVFIVVIVAITKAVESALEVCYGDLQKRNRLGRVAESQVVRGVFSAITAGAVLFLGGQLWGAACAILGVALIALAIEWVGRRRLRMQARPASLTRIRTLLVKIWPLGVSAGMTSLNGSWPRLICFPILGAEAAGYVALLSYPASLLSLLGNSLGQAHLVRFRTARRRGDQRVLRRAVRAPLATMAALGLGLALSAAWVALLLPISDAVEKYLEAAPLFIISATLAGLSAIAFHLQTSSGIYRFHPYLSGATSVVAVSALMPFTLIFGITGVGLAMIVYYFFQFVAWMVAGLRTTWEGGL